ncbi:toxin TcdB middle/N-terminal domain-containing protein [Streptomyces europaeiscabiei]|uniref:toxin TcdB middle/N-terminal domain-containing protein n=1 Tax=Streptomyces europaeiscabiei TaxID=146819 RepID=UPI0029B3C683|nr:toxin TcdB middle/N-terminal domain-containing protein [Streptomyces europaeiscabiei]MDX3775900.1 toxin TcdB middle/N-terminal domain-containing protein [Streptomyces europaeiscabiei]
MLAAAGNIDRLTPRVVDFGAVPFDVALHDATADDTYIAAGCYLSGDSAERRLTVQWPVPPAQVEMALLVPAGGARYRITQTYADDSTVAREEDAAPGHIIGLDAGLRQVEIVALVGPLVVETITMAAERVPEVVTRYRLDYHSVLGDGAVDPAAVAPSVSLLSRLHQAGYDDALQEATLPPSSFEYQPLSLAGVFPRKLVGTPAEALGRQATPLSFFGTGRPDIMQTESGHRVFFNRGQLGTDIVVDRRELVASPSAEFGDGDVLLRDIDGRGAVDLSTTAYFYRNPAKLGPVSRTAPAWAAAVDFDPIRRHPQLSAAELPRSRSVDLNGDGCIDLLTTAEDFWEWTNLGDGGWSAGRQVSRIVSFGDKLFPDVSFDDASVFIADMNGDGLDEIVRVSARKVEYWARSRETWTFKTTMRAAPRWSNFEPDRVIVADVTGNGMADLVYLTGNGVALALNRGGDRFSPIIQLDFADGLSRGLPMPTSERGTLVVDLLGDGTKGLLWSLARADVEPNYFFLPLCAAGQPGLLTAIDNGTGGRVELQYTTSSRQSAEDELGGRPWSDEPPYPVTVVDEIREIDRVTGARLVRQFRYRDGFYDRQDREFRGFGRVEETVLNSSVRKGCRIVHEFATGKPTSAAPADRARARALAGAELRTSHHDLRTGALLRRTVRQLEVMLIHEWSAAGVPAATPLTTAAGEQVAFAYETRRLESAYEGTSAPRHALWEESRLVPSPSGPVLDEYGRITEEIIHGEVVPTNAAAVATFDIDGVAVALQPADLTRRRRVAHEYAADRNLHLVRHRCRDTTWGGATFTQLLMERRWYFDGGTDADDHLPLGQVAQGNIQREETLAARPADLQAVVGGGPVGYLKDGQSPAYLWRQVAADGVESWFSVDRRRIFAQAGGRIRYGTVRTDIDACGSATTREYDDALWYVRRELNELGQQSVHRAICYRASRPREIEQPDGTVTSTAFDGLGRATAVTEDSAAVPVPQTTTIRDTQAFLRAGTPAVETTKRLIDRLENPPRYAEEIRYLDGWGRTVQTRRTSDSHGGDLVVVDRGYAAGGKEATFESVPYAATGRAYAASAVGVGVTRRRDALFRVFEIDFPGAVKAQLAYQPWSLTLNDPEDLGIGSAAGTPTLFRLDYGGRVLSVTTDIRDGAGPGMTSTAQTSYGYDAMDRLVRVTDANNTTTTIRYDARGDAIRVRHADAGDTVRLYDAGQRRIYERDAAGVVRWYGFDALGRVTGEVPGADPSQNPTVVYNYDGPAATGIGRLTSAQDLVTDVLSQYSYDGRGNVTRVIRTLAGVVVDDVAVEYNDLRAPRRRTFAGGVQLEYDFGADGLMAATRLVRADGVQVPMIAGVTYHPTGRVAQANLCGGAVVYQASFDAQTQRLRHRGYRTATATVLYEVDNLGYDAVGNVVAFREQAPSADPVTWALAYDSAYRLRRADGARPGGAVAAFGYRYDIAGNVTRNDEVAPGQAVTYDAARPDVLDRVGGGPQFIHDAAGRLNAGPDYQLVRWNERDLVDRIVAAAGSQLDLFYDHDRQLVAMTRTTPGGGAEELLFLGPEHERHAGVDYYSATLDDLPCVAARSDGSAVVLTRGMAESVVRLIDDTGAVVPDTTELYGPYGSAIEAAAEPWPRGFANAIRAVPSMYLTGVRPYLAGLGRFGAVDPVLLNRLDRELLHEPRRISPYLYALGNPHGYVDPSGLLALVDDVIFYGVGSLLGLRNDSFFAGVGQNFVESWSVVLRTIVPFHGGQSLDSHVPAWLLQRSWGITNEAVGLIVAYGAVELFGGTTRMSEQVQLVEVPTTSNWGAFTLGDKVIGHPDFLSGTLPSGITGWRHEQGHYYQNLLLGPLYFPVIAIPSIVHAGLHDTIHPGKSWEDFYTETWATEWGKK